MTTETFRGKVMLVTFGYIFCPDVCPTTLATIGQALDLSARTRRMCSRSS